jgi:hypothetical protein
MPNSHWKKLAKNIYDGSINKRNFHDYADFYEIMQDIAERMKKYGYYTFDCRFEDCVIKIVCDKFKSSINDINLEEIALSVTENLKKLIVPNIILIPLNHLNSIILDAEIAIDKDISLFPMNEKSSKTKKDKSLLSRYVEKKIFCKLNANRILMTKDPYFFNYPILAIKIEHVDFRVEHEAPKIVESSYSLLRMLDFDLEREPNDKGWGVGFRDEKPEAYTYTVYYKESGSDFKNLKTGKLGYSFRFKFSPILDINTIEFIHYKEKYTDLLKKVIEYSFISENELTNKEFLVRKKWVNSIILFNTVYEFASIGKFDAALLLMFSILESLFFNLGDYNTKEKLIARLSSYLEPFEFNVDIKTLIKETTEYRNNFVHQGIGLERFKTYRSLNDREGFLQGQKPFVHGSWYPMPDKEFNDYLSLMKLVIFILTNDTDSLFKYYCERVDKT